MENLQWKDLIGKKVIAFRGMTHKESKYSKKKTTQLQYMLFDDEETYLEFDEQDPYDYHDCNSSARTMQIVHNPKFWEIMFNKENGFAEPDDLGYSAF